MSSHQFWPLVAIAVVGVMTLVVSARGWGSRRSTSDFYVASRRVRPWLNASAIAGEYLSAASFLGVAGLIIAFGQHGLWFPVGYAAGFLSLLVLVAAPLRRSGAYTIPDLMSLRFGSAPLRRLTAGFVVVTGWLYIVPQFHGASLTLSATTGFPGVIGPLAVVLVVLPTVFSGGMRSVTVAQAIQYWFKLSALLIPTIFVVLRLSAGGSDADSSGIQLLARAFEAQLSPDSFDTVYRTLSLVAALMLGAVGLSHVLVRFYTNPDGDSARRTTVLLLGLLAGFYLLPVTLGVIARAVMPALASGATDTAIIFLPAEIFSGLPADALTALLAGGAFAAFLSTASGLTVSISAVVAQEFFAGSVRGFRWGAILAVGFPLIIAMATSQLALAGTVAMVFTFTASTLAPVVILSIWWPGITSKGAASGLMSGALISLGATAVLLLLPAREAWPAVLFAYPALWSIPATFAITMLVSSLGATQPPANTKEVLARLHLPEQLRR